MPGHNDRKQLDAGTAGDRSRVVVLPIDTAAAIGEGDHEAFFVADTDGGNLVQPLPVIADIGPGFVLRFKNIDAANNLVITPNAGAGDLIDGGVSSALTNGAANAIVSTVVDGAPDQWRVFATA